MDGVGVGVDHCGVGATKLVSLWGKSVLQVLRVGIFEGSLGLLLWKSILHVTTVGDHCNW